MAIGQEEIGRRIAEARVDAGLNQRQLAELIGVADAQSISRYERGKTEVSTGRLRKIAEATGKPMDYFVLEIPGEEPEVTPDQLEALAARVEEVLAAVVELRQIVEPLAAAQQKATGDNPPAPQAT